MVLLVIMLKTTIKLHFMPLVLHKLHTFNINIFICQIFCKSVLWMPISLSLLQNLDRFRSYPSAWSISYQCLLPSILLQLFSNTYDAHLSPSDAVVTTVHLSTKQYQCLGFLTPSVKTKIMNFNNIYHIMALLAVAVIIM